MNITILDDIDFKVDIPYLMEKLHIEAGSEDSEKIEELVKEAENIGKPKALYKASYIEAKGDDFVIIDGIQFTSHILRVNLDNAHKVFPFIITCGKELSDWSSTIVDIFESYWAQTIKEMVLGEAIKTFQLKLAEEYKIAQASNMNPGSLEDWPISQQGPLFKLLGDPLKSIGVKLTESFIMKPMKSVSGIRFHTEDKFENCQLCPREHCPNRRLPFKPHLYQEKYKASDSCCKVF